MSYPVVVVIIIITAVVSYLIGMLDAKATSKLIERSKNKDEKTPIEITPDINFKNVAQLQINAKDELLVEIDQNLINGQFTVDITNKNKIDELISALNTLTNREPVLPKISPPPSPEPKPKLAMQRSLFGTSSKKKSAHPSKVMDLVAMLNEKLSAECEGLDMVLDVREDSDHQISFWVNDRVFANVDEVQPEMAKDIFTKVLDEMKKNDH